MNVTSKLRFVRFAFLVFFAAAALFAGRAVAQSAADAAKIAVSLPADTHAVIDRLSSLRELPDAAWKMHSGDLAHGEALNLDESSWQPIAVGSLAPKDAVWFRQTYKVPATLNGYDLTGARIWFQFHSTPTGRCRRFSTSTAGAWPWATIWSRWCCLTRRNPATR